MRLKNGTEENDVVSYPNADWLTGFLYLLMRDAVPCGEVEAIVQELEEDDAERGLVVYTNGHLARYAHELAGRLRQLRKSEP